MRRIDRKSKVAKHASVSYLPGLPAPGVSPKKTKQLIKVKTIGSKPKKRNRVIKTTKKFLPSVQRVASSVVRAATPKPSIGKGGGGKNKGGGGNGLSAGGAVGNRDLAMVAGNPNVGSAIDPLMAMDGADLFDPKLATTMANQEYDPQLNVVRDSQGRQKADAAQALHDIEQWYGQVLTSQGKAGERNKLAGETATGSIGRITQDIISSLGGAANAGSAMVGAQGANDADTSALMSQAEQQYQNDLTPLLELERSGAQRGETVRQSNVARDLTNQLLQLTGQKGAARTANVMKLQELNNQIRDHRLDSLLNIKQYNNTLTQQQFTNRLSAQQARIAAEIGQAQIGVYKSQAKGGSAFTPWAGLDPSQRSDLIAAATGSSIDEQGGLMGDPNNAWNLARQYLSGQGYTSAKKGAKGRSSTQISQMIDAALRHAISVNKRRQQLKNEQGN